MDTITNYDFGGWATKNDLLCSDGRTIRRDAFKDCDGQTVPLLWNHRHDDPTSVIGQALLHNTEDGVYAYCSLNDTNWGRHVKDLIVHGDVNALSIYANKLKHVGSSVVHGIIREVSVVLAGANPGACINSVLCHGDEDDDEAYIYTGEELEITHSAMVPNEKTTEGETKKMKEKNNEKTVQDVVDSMTDEQRDVLYSLVGKALEMNDDDNEEGDDDNMKHNVFDTEEDEGTVLAHDAMETIINDGKRFGSMKDSYLEHADEYGIENIEYLFPDFKNTTTQPQYIQRDDTWVNKFMAGVHHTPFSRIKSVFADITEDQARAKGYFKGNLKKEEVFSLLKRTTEPTTIYKKQKMNKDDVSDIKDFDAVSMIKTEMRMMLEEEIARASLVGDGRSTADDDHIDSSKIRPVWTDEELFTIKARFDAGRDATEDVKAKEFIKTAIKSRKKYKGSGNPILYTTEDVVTSCLLLTDTTGRDIYDSVDKLATKLRVREIVTVPVMEGLNRTDDGGTYDLMGIILNPSDYNIGADKGGSIDMFEDFDIDFNQMKYLIETRCSGALTKPYSAIAIESKRS